MKSSAILMCQEFKNNEPNNKKKKSNDDAIETRRARGRRIFDLETGAVSFRRRIM